MKKIFTILLMALGSMLAMQRLDAQVGIGTNAPSANAMLDVTSATKGILLPRLTAAQQTTLAATLTAAQAGMMVTDATTGKPIIWTGGAWKDAGGITITSTTPLLVSATNTISLNPGTAAGDLITYDGANWVNKQPAKASISVDNRQPYLAINYCIGLVGIFPSRNANEPFVGEIDMFSFGFTPKGYAQCNGQLLPINQNQALFSLLGTQYGGNGQTNFALPNLQSRIPVHMGSNGTTTYTIGQTGGVELNTITH